MYVCMHAFLLISLLCVCVCVHLLFMNWWDQFVQVCAFCLVGLICVCVCESMQLGTDRETHECVCVCVCMHLYAYAPTLVRVCVEMGVSEHWRARGCCILVKRRLVQSRFRRSRGKLRFRQKSIPTTASDSHTRTWYKNAFLPAVFDFVFISN